MQIGFAITFTGEFINAGESEFRVEREALREPRHFYGAGRAIEKISEGSIAMRSHIDMDGNDFRENGTILFSDGSSIRVKSIHDGNIDRHESILYGGIVWKVVGGNGVFRNASGYISNCFSLVKRISHEQQCAMIELAEK